MALERAHVSMWVSAPIWEEAKLIYWAQQWKGNVHLMYATSDCIGTDSETIRCSMEHHVSH